VNLPSFPALTDETLTSLAARHGFAGMPITPLPALGICNALFLLGDDLILRMPRAHPTFTALTRKEALAVPAARAAGVRTPELIVFDDSLALLPVPYTIYTRVPGETLELLRLEPEQTSDAWRAVGHDLALLHASVRAEGSISELASETLDDPRTRVEELARKGYFSPVEARWLTSWLERLAPLALTPVPSRFIHNDVQATNIIVGPEQYEYRSLLDWGSCGWGDPAHDFAAMPLRAVPFLLAGYRAVRPLDADATAEARIVWRHLQIALWLARRGPQPGLSWGEQPLGMLVEVLRFFLERPGEPWAALAP
jgi:aminoglycoside phosphotransferase (APT) family kinase protein